MNVVSRKNEILNASVSIQEIGGGPRAGSGIKRWGEREAKRKKYGLCSCTRHYSISASGSGGQLYPNLHSVF
jgi:hypothetical protein